MVALYFSCSLSVLVEESDCVMEVPSRGFEWCMSQRGGSDGRNDISRSVLSRRRLVVELKAPSCRERDGEGRLRTLSCCYAVRRLLCCCCCCRHAACVPACCCCCCCSFLVRSIALCNIAVAAVDDVTGCVSAPFVTSLPPIFSGCVYNSSRSSKELLACTTGSPGSN